MSRWNGGINGQVLGGYDYERKVKFAESADSRIAKGYCHDLIDDGVRQFDWNRKARAGIAAGRADKGGVDATRSPCRSTRAPPEFPG